MESTGPPAGASAAHPEGGAVQLRAAGRPGAARWAWAFAGVLLAAAGVLHLAFNLGMYLPLQWERTDRGRDVTFTH